MSFDAARLLPLLLLAFYLKDCLLLLDSDEAVLVTSAFGRPRLGFGWRHYTIRGREPYLCNPLLPFEPAVRWRWSAAGAGSAAAQVSAEPPLRDGSSLSTEVSLPPAAAGQRAIAALAATAAVVFLLALPVALLAHRGIGTLGALLGLGYTAIVLALAVVFRQRRPLGLSRGQFASLAAEVLLCPPYAANLLRRLTLRHRRQGDLLAVAPTLLGPTRAAQAYRECAARVAAQLEIEDEDSPRAAGLRQAQQALLAREGLADV